MRTRRVIAAASCLVMLMLPVHAHAASDIPTRQLLVGHIATTGDAGTGFTSTFNALGAGTSQPGVQPVAGYNTFWMSVTAYECCTVHAFVLGHWTGWWNLNHGELYGTATGDITAQCFNPGAEDCITPPALGPLTTFKLTIWGGTGSYAGATGYGQLTGVQTIQTIDWYVSAPGGVVFVPPTPPAAWSGWLALTMP